MGRKKRNNVVLYKRVPLELLEELKKLIDFKLKEYETYKEKLKNFT